MSDPEPRDDITSIQILALKSREKPTFESEIRKVMRWYSKEFSTPLAEVEKIDIHTLLLTRFEDYVQNLPAEEYNKYKRKLLYADVIEQEETEDDDWITKELEALAKAQSDLNEKNKKAATKPNLPEETIVDLEF